MMNRIFSKIVLFNFQKQEEEEKKTRAKWGKTWKNTKSVEDSGWWRRRKG